MNPAPKPRVMFILERYPQLSETYIKTEINALKADYDLQVVSFERVDHPDPDHHPFEFLPEPRDILNAIRAFKPSILHTHYLVNAGKVLALAQASGVPFTVRAHSYDSLTPPGQPGKPYFQHLGGIFRHPLCLGVLAFPFTLPLLSQLGVPLEKVRGVPPVVDFDLFHDESPNAGGVMNTGACLPKKGTADFIALARLVPELEFDFYPVGYLAQELADLNTREGSPARLRSTVPHREMPRIYKQHRWLVYTASFEHRTVGWPMAIAEAQAAGVGIVMANIRPDLKDYLGGGGFLYDTLEEAADLLRRPYPEELRERGFENARRCDIHSHKHLLTELWAKAL